MILTLLEMTTSKKNRLYCTFVQKDKLDETLGLLKDRVDGKIFVLDISKEHEVVLTYNLLARLPQELLETTVLCHRHRVTRTIYTINALNTIVKLETGTEDKNYKINWSEYQDSLLVVQDRQLIQFKTKLINII